MKILGISIEGTKVIFSSLEKKGDTSITEISNATRKLELNDHLDSAEIRQLMSAIHAFLAGFCFDKIGIIKRGTKGNFAASPISFKIEGLIQAFPDADIDFVAPATIRAFYKKNTLDVQPKYAYQMEAIKLAYYLSEK